MARDVNAHSAVDPNVIRRISFSRREAEAGPHTVLQQQHYWYQTHVFEHIVRIAVTICIFSFFSSIYETK